MSRLDLYHISFFDSILKGLQNSGSSLDYYSNQTPLNHFELLNPNTYLPIDVGYSLFKTIKKKEAIDCISSEFYGGFSISDLSEYGEYLSSCPDLYSILINVMKYDCLIQTSGRFDLKIEGPLSSFTMVHLDRPSKYRLISEKINLAMFAKTFQMVLGLDWHPVEINTTTSDEYWIENLFRSKNFKVNTNSKNIGFKFYTTELETKNKYYQSKQIPTVKDISSIESIAEIVFENMKPGKILTMTEFSNFFGFSKRTGARKFAKAQITYKSLLEKHLFMKSLELLKDSKLTIENVSLILGYSHPSNFIRAFKCWTQTTPNEYRNKNFGF